MPPHSVQQPRPARRVAPGQGAFREKLLDSLLHTHHTAPTPLPFRLELQHRRTYRRREAFLTLCLRPGTLLPAPQINNVWTDASVGKGLAIPGDLSWARSSTLLHPPLLAVPSFGCAAAWQASRCLCSLLFSSSRFFLFLLAPQVEGLQVRSQANYILVVEKEAVFHRLCDERVFDRLPLLLLTARGMPDLASRAALHRLSALLPRLPVLALVDWNPSGVLIMSTFKHGSTRMGGEGGHFAVPALRWLGARSTDVPELAEGETHPAVLPLTKRCAHHTHKHAVSCWLLCGAPKRPVLYAALHQMQE